LWYGRLFPFLQVLCLLLESKNVLAALSCSLIRFRKCSPFSFLFGFPWSPSRSGLKSLWNSNSTSPLSLGAICKSSSNGGTKVCTYDGSGIFVGQITEEFGEILCCFVNFFFWVTRRWV